MNDIFDKQQLWQQDLQSYSAPYSWHGVQEIRLFWPGDRNTPKREWGGDVDLKPVGIHSRKFSTLCKQWNFFLLKKQNHLSYKKIYLTTTEAEYEI